MTPQEEAGNYSRLVLAVVSVYYYIGFMVLESTLDNYIYLYRKKQNTEAQARGRNFSLSVLKLSRSSNPVRSPHIVGDHRQPQVLQSPRHDDDATAE